MNTVVEMPTSSHPGPRAGRWLKAAGLGLWRSMEDTGRAKAQRALLDLAYQFEAARPDRARELRVTSRELLLA